MRAQAISHTTARRAALLMVAAGFAVSPLVGDAIGVALPSKTLITYPLDIKVSLKITQKVHWKGIKAGCFAPQENFDMTYDVSFKTHPQGGESKVKNATVTLVGDRYGSTFSLGAKGGARQSGKEGTWDLETAYPGGQDCGPDPAPPVPPGITAPNCRPVSERVAATFVASTDGKKGDGTLVLRRTPKVANTAFGASIGQGCLRTLHGTKFTTVASEVDISEKQTYVQIPIPKLHDALLDLAIVSNPTRSWDVNFSGDCHNMRMKPSIGPDPDFTLSPSQPHDSIGQAWSEPGSNACLMSGQGTITISRAGPLTKTVIPVIPK